MALVAWLVLARSGALGLPTGDLLVAPDLPRTTLQGGLPLGATGFYNAWTAEGRGSKTIRLLKVEVLGLPKGVILDHVWAVRWTDTHGHSMESYGHQMIQRLQPLLHPLSDVEIDPTCTPLHTRSSRCFSDSLNPSARVMDWDVMIQVHTTAPGHYGPTAGLRFYYVVDGQEYRQDTHNWGFGIITTPPEYIP